MAEVLIRGLDPAIKRRLQEQARRHGVSMEAEARDILTRGVGRTGTRLDRIRQAVEEVGGVDLALPERTELPRAADLS